MSAFFLQQDQKGRIKLEASVCDQLQHRQSIHNKHPSASLSRIEIGLRYLVKYDESSSHYVKIGEGAAEHEVAREADAGEYDPRNYCSFVEIVLVDLALISTVFYNLVNINDSIAEYEDQLQGQECGGRTTHAIF